MEMRTVKLRTPGGDLDVALPPPGDVPSFYLFALHKSGSTLLNDMMAAALERAGIPQIAIPEATFSAGLAEHTISNPEEIVFARGYCYRGFRRFPAYLGGFDLARQKKILLVRDPRDMAVSLYFSIAESHSMPAQGTLRDNLMAQRAQARAMGIDEFCIGRVAFIRSEFEGYEPILASETRIYRYEDVIFDKAAWLADMLAYLGVVLEPAAIARIAAANDIRPDRERPAEHVRQVAPGNHRKHLAPTTRDRLDREFSDILVRYEYAKPGAEAGPSHAYPYRP